MVLLPSLLVSLVVVALNSSAVKFFRPVKLDGKAPFDGVLISVNKSLKIEVVFFVILGWC